MHHRCYRAEKGQSQYGTFFSNPLPIFYLLSSRPVHRPALAHVVVGKKEEELPLKPLYCTSLKKLQPYTARAYIVTLKSGYLNKD